MKVVEIAKTLGLPATATEAQVFGEILRLKANATPAGEQLVALAKARGGDFRAEVQNVARTRPDLVTRWRTEQRLGARSAS